MFFKDSRQPVDDQSKASQLAPKAVNIKDNGTAARKAVKTKDDISQTNRVPSECACLFYKVHPSLLYAWRWKADKDAVFLIFIYLFICLFICLFCFVCLFMLMLPPLPAVEASRAWLVPHVNCVPSEVWTLIWFPAVFCS